MALSVTLYHCIFNNGSITHYMHDRDVDLHKPLPNLYAVLVLCDKSGLRHVISGFFVKTSLSHNDPQFSSMCHAALAEMENALVGTSREIILHSVLVGATADEDEPLTENEMTGFMLRKYLALHQANRA